MNQMLILNAPMTASINLERAAANVPYLRRKRLQIIEEMLDAKGDLAIVVRFSDVGSKRVSQGYLWVGESAIDRAKACHAARV